MKKLFLFQAVISCCLAFIGAECKDMIDVRKYGAKGDGLTLDTRAIQKALDTGKIVFFPAGVYRSGTIYLRSGGGLHLDANAVILGSRSPADYNSADFDPRNTSSVKECASGAHLIVAADCTDISIGGRGTVCGNRTGIFNTDIILTPNGARPRYQLPQWRPSAMIYLVGCRGVKIRDVSLNDSPYWTCFLHDCENVVIENVTIHNDRFTNNSDGLDIDCCRHVKITGCTIFSGDDAIAIRGNQTPLKKDAPCSDITVSDCILSSAACGVRIGVGNGAISDCRLSGLKMVDTRIGIGICPSYGGGKCTAIRKVVFENCRIDSVQTILMLPGWQKDIDDPEAKKVTNLTFRKIEAVASRASLLADSRQGGMFENIVFEDSVFTLLPDSESPNRPAFWTDADYGIINLLGMKGAVFSNCRGISAEGKPFILRRDR